MVAGYQSISPLSKGQRGVHSQVLQQLMQGLQSGQANIQQSPLYQQGSSFIQSLLSGSPGATQAFTAPAMREFEEQIVPMLAERFSGWGAGAQGSSAFSQALGSAGAGLSERLASLRGQLGLQGAQLGLGYAQQPTSNLLGFSQLGLGTQAQGYVPRQRPWWQTLLNSLGGIAGETAGSMGTAWGQSLFRPQQQSQ